VFFNGGFFVGFSYFFLRLLEPDLHTSVAFFKTRAPQPRSPSSFAPAARSTGHVGRRCPTRGLHTPESLFSLTRVTATLHLFWPCRVGDGVYGGRSTVGWCR
jgi:hypothetical protein